MARRITRITSLVSEAAAIEIVITRMDGVYYVTVLDIADYPSARFATYGEALAYAARLAATA